MKNCFAANFRNRRVFATDQMNMRYFITSKRIYYTHITGFWENLKVFFNYVDIPHQGFL